MFLQRHRGTSLCLCFVSVISVPFSIITWQLIPPGAGFWLLICLYESGIGCLVLWEAQLNIWTNLYCPTLLGPVQPNLVLGTVAQPTFIIALFFLPIFIFTLPVPSRPALEVGQRQTETESGWEIEPSCYPLLHKASVLPLTVDGLLCRSLQPMASALYYIYCPLFSSLSPSLLFTWIWRRGGLKEGQGESG